MLDLDFRSRWFASMRRLNDNLREVSSQEPSRALEMLRQRRRLVAVKYRHYLVP